jgi:hypothetical protein
MDKDARELTPDDLHKALMEVWARRTERELGRGKVATSQRHQRQVDNAEHA